MSRLFAPVPALALILSLASACCVGCGDDGDRLESGTQVEVSDTLLQEAEAGEKYMLEQARAKKSQPKGNRDAVEPGAP